MICFETDIIRVTNRLNHTAWDHKVNALHRHEQRACGRSLKFCAKGIRIPIPAERSSYLVASHEHPSAAEDYRDLLPLAKHESKTVYINIKVLIDE